ncbi:MAG: hypothetical protein QW222_01585 [Candidatus Bathyarchaeia archaeon]
MEEQESGLSGGKRKRLLITCVTIGVVIFLLAEVAWASWLFSMKVEGWWMQNKAGVNIWDISFERGFFWMTLWLVPLVWVLSDPFFWRKRPTMKMLMRILKRDENKTTARERFRIGLLMLCGRALLGFAIAVFLGHELARQLLLVNTYLSLTRLSWLDFIVKKYFGSLVFWLSGNLPNANYLIENTVIFDFLGVLWYLLFPIFIYWSIKLFSGGIYEAAREKRFLSLIRGLLSIFLIWFLYFGILTIPNTVADISTPIFMVWRVPLLALTCVAISLTFAKNKVKAHPFLITVPTALLILIVLIAPLAQVWYNYYFKADWSASKNIFEFPYKDSPHISYVKWANDLEGIQTLPLESITTPMEFEEKLLKQIRTISYVAAIRQMVYSYGKEVGQPWMKIALEQEGGKYLYGPMIVWANGHEYWVAPTSPVLPEQTDTEVAKKYLYTHSEVILAVDAATGEVVPIDKVFPQVNASTIAMYYGIGGLFKDQEIIYLKIGNWKETHLPTFKGPEAYEGMPDYVFGDEPVGGILWWVSERAWFFIWRGEWAFAQGMYGPRISVLFHRDVVDRVRSLLVNDLELENEPATNNPIPYLVFDENGKIFYAFAVYINKPLTTGYADTARIGQYVTTSGNFRRPFALLLVNTYDGTIQGFRYGNWEENYITRYFASFYPYWNKPLPDWVKEQVRYPKSLMRDLIDLYNTYRIDPDDWDSWHKTLNMFDFPIDKNWNYFSTEFDDIRYVPIYHQGRLMYGGIRLVELYQQKSEQWTARKVAGIYVFFGTGEKFFIPIGNAMALQLVLDSINTNRDIQYILTTTQQRGERWEEGNLMLYIISGKPVFFIPYYTMTATVMKVTMVVAVDAITGDVGYYQLSANPAKEEVEIACARAYTAMRRGLLKSEQEKVDQVKNEFIKSGFTVVEPEDVNPMITEKFASVDFRITQQWNNVNATIHKFMEEVCAPNDVKTVYIWVKAEGPTKVLYVAALLQPSLVMEIIKITIS